MTLQTMTFRFLAFAFVAMSCISIQAQTAFFTKTSSDTVTAIPDGPNGSRTSTITIASGEFVAGHLIQSIDFRLDNAQHGWVGDLIFSVQHSLSGQTATLFNRVGRSSGVGIGDSSNLSGSYSFRDGSPSFWTEAAQGGDTYTITPHNAAKPPTTGFYAASGQDESVVSLNNIFGGRSPQGTWTFTMSDLNAGNAGTYDTVTVNMITAIPEPGAIAGLGLLGMFGTIYVRRRYNAKQKQATNKTA